MATSANGQRAGPNITSGGSGLPSRIILHGVEGVGKSSFGAFAPKPIFFLTGGETGLLTLIDNGLAPETPHFDPFVSWRDLLGAMRWLASDEAKQHDFRTLALDTLNGAQILCFEHVCRSNFQGDLDKFLAYGRGPEIAVGEWANLFAALDELRAARKMGLILLCHTKIKTFKNPEGEDYDRYSPELHDKCWGPAAKWADVILFANFETLAKKERGAMRAKGQDCGTRVLYTQRTAVYDAKNRLGLPPEIPMGEKPASAWNNFVNAARKVREDSKQRATSEVKGGA